MMLARLLDSLWSVVKPEQVQVDYLLVIEFVWLICWHGFI